MVLFNSHAEHLRTVSCSFMVQLNYFHSQLTPSEVQGSVKKLGQAMNEQFGKQYQQKEKSVSFDCKVKMPFSLFHQNIQIPGHHTLLQGRRPPQWKQRKLSKTSDPAEPAMRKLGTLQLAGRKEIPLSQHFPASLTRKKMIFIPPSECFLQLDDCARIKEILPFPLQNIQNPAV